ncbi:hypothetical protein BDZ45DRAFT_753013 [Acephala macrosclerotiorum]|nr:hypothetical protein BDZ45DRAFT_753013 [Acephala macrosclerotiorum]
MARLITLPEELLHQVVSNLEPELLSLTSRPFAYFPPYLGKYLEITHQQNKEIQSLAQTCKHLHDRLFATIHNQTNINNAEISAKLYDAIENNGRLGLSITTAHLHGNLSLQSVEFIFFLPNIHTVYFRGWSDWAPFEQGMELNDGSSLSPNGASPVTHLYLTDCGAHEGALNQLLNWPKELKELWYEASQAEWHGHYGDGNAPGFTCSAVARALEPLKNSLEKLVFTRSDPNHEGLFYSNAIDLSGFSKLTELSIFHVLLVGYSAQETIWKNIPPNLESLEVWFDDSGYKNFICDGAPAGLERPDWLFGILEHKEEAFPRLGRVRVVSLEWWDEDQDKVLFQEQDDGESEEVGFRLPGELARGFEESGVSYSVYLHESRRWKVVVDGGLRFDKKWDEEDIEYPHNL